MTLNIEIDTRMSCVCVCVFEEPKWLRDVQATNRRYEQFQA